MTEPIHHDKLIRDMQNETPLQGATELTEREQEILRLVATGTSNKEIAHQLFISSNTVKVHIRNIFAKIGVSSRTEAAVYAIHTGLTQATEIPGSEPITREIPAEPPTPLFGSRTRLFLWISALVAVLAVGAAAYFLSRYFTPRPAVASPATVDSQRWQELAALPVARSGLAVAVYGNQFYAVGGESSQGVTGQLEQYDVATDKWTTLSPKPVPVTDVNAAVIGGQIYIPGGRLASGGVTNILESYDPGKNQWEKHAALPVALSGYALVPFEGKLFLFGGWDGKKFLATVYEYSPDIDKWNERTPMPTARGFAGAAMAGGSIFVIGGYDGKEPLTVNEVYLPERDIWSKRAPLPVGRHAFGIASIADYIYVIGGVGKTSSALLPLQYFPQKDQWQEFTGPLTEHWSHLSLVSYQTKFYGLGGQSNGVPSTQNLSYQAIYLITIPLIP